MSQLSLSDGFTVQQAIKQCLKCLAWKSLAAFPKRGNRCNECLNERARERRANETADERIRRNQIQWLSRLKAVYGISPEILQTIYDDQGGKCYFCGSAKPLRGRGALAIDHNHDTGKIRGLLCNPCNANFLAPYEQLPKELQDSPRTNAYLIRGKSGEYIEDIRNRLGKATGQPVSK